MRLVEGRNLDFWTTTKRAPPLNKWSNEMLKRSGVGALGTGVEF